MCLCKKKVEQEDFVQFASNELMQFYKNSFTNRQDLQVYLFLLYHVDFIALSRNAHYVQEKVKLMGMWWQDESYTASDQIQSREEKKKTTPEECSNTQTLTTFIYFNPIIKPFLTVLTINFQPQNIIIKNNGFLQKFR